MGQWIQIENEEEAQEGKGEDGEGKRNCGEHTNLLENEQKDPCPSYLVALSIALRWGIMFLLETLGNYY